MSTSLYLFCCVFATGIRRIKIFIKTLTKTKKITDDDYHDDDDDDDQNLGRSGRCCQSLVVSSEVTQLVLDVGFQQKQLDIFAVKNHFGERDGAAKVLLQRGQFVSSIHGVQTLDAVQRLQLLHQSTLAVSNLLWSRQHRQ